MSDDSYENSQILTRHFGGDKPRGISVVSAGAGAKNSLLGCLNFSWYDPKRKLARYKQAGRGGIGSVFADKNIKALVVRWDKVKVDINKPADLEAFKVVARSHTKEIKELDPKQNDMATVGTTHLVTIMNDHDTLPIRNFKFGRHPEAVNLGEDVYRPIFDKGFDGCWYGCAVACAHGVKDFVPMTGPFKGQKVFVDGPEYETVAGVGSNLGIFDPHFVLEMNFYCDNYGVDTISIGTATAFIMECFELGLISEKQTGRDLSFGNKLGALELLHELSRGEGFGKLLGIGIRRMKKVFAEEYGADAQIIQDIGMESKGLEFSEYISKESLAQQGGYGLGLKGAQHDEAWLIFLDAVHNFMPTFEQKANNLHWFPMFRTWFSLCGLCKLPWNDIVPEDNNDTAEPAKVIKHVEWYIEYFRSVTGRDLDQDSLITMSEGVYNFQRLFNLKMGYGKREHDTIPYRAVGPVFPEEYEFYQEKYDTELTDKFQFDIEGKTTEEKVAALRKNREEQYEMLKDAVYEKRGWTADGIPTLAKVKSLHIDFPDVVELLKENGVQ